VGKWEIWQSVDRLRQRKIARLLPYAPSAVPVFLNDEIVFWLLFIQRSDCYRMPSVQVEFSVRSILTRAILKGKQQEFSCPFVAFFYHDKVGFHSVRMGFARRFIGEGGRVFCEARTMGVETWLRELEKDVVEMRIVETVLGKVEEWLSALRGWTLRKQGKPPEFPEFEFSKELLALEAAAGGEWE